MARYAVGDIQGCYAPLQCLLGDVNFDQNVDELWVAGDLVNRGPQSLEVLRLIKQLGQAAKVVLGNHDLHLLAISHGAKKLSSKDTLAAIFDAADGNDLLTWLQQQKLLLVSDDEQWVMSHAGIPPMWSLAKAQSLAAEVEITLQSDNAGDFFNNMYGNQPSQWDESLTGYERLRCITNYLTRMRFCTQQGRLDLEDKASTHSKKTGFDAWFRFPHQLGTSKLLFGHWAALNGHTESSQFIGLDTGCVWGQTLTMVRLDDGQYFSCECR